MDTTPYPTVDPDVFGTWIPEFDWSSGYETGRCVAYVAEGGLIFDLAGRIVAAYLPCRRTNGRWSFAFDVYLAATGELIGLASDDTLSVVEMVDHYLADARYLD